MKASILDLRYRMKDVLSALRRSQAVEVLYRGKTFGKIIPAQDERTSSCKVKDHALFGMYADDQRSVDEVINDLRGGRYRDL